MVDGAGIHLEDISFRIGRFAMENLSLTVRKGEYFVLTGPNGSGKTILVKLVAGLLHPEAGTIRINGQPVIDLPPWKRNIGYIPQEGLLFKNMTVRGNIRFALEVRGLDGRTIRSKVEQVASMMEIEHLLDRMPGGLSGGERQKVSLARALVFKPSVLLLDEPVSAIDEKARSALCRVLRRIQRETGVTALHVSHSREESDLVADRMGVLTDGCLRNVIVIREKDD